MRLLDVDPYLVHYPKRERRSTMYRFPHVQQPCGKGSVTQMFRESLTRHTEIDKLGPVIDLVGEGVRGLVHVHGTDKAEVAGKRYELSRCKLDRSLPVTRPDFHRREEAGEVVLHTRQVHLIEDQMKRFRCNPCGRSDPVRLRCFTEKAAEGRVLIGPLYRIEEAEQILVGGP